MVITSRCSAGADARICLGAWWPGTGARRTKRGRGNWRTPTQSTRALGQAIAQCTHPPRVWLQASTATIYAHRYDAPNDEASGILGGDEPDAPETWRFSIGVAQQWERVAREAATPGTRQVLLRSAMTMSPDADGVFDVLLGLVRYRLGGHQGDGRQYVSWIHDRDFIRATYLLIERGAGFGLPASGWMLETGAAFLRTETELILKSRRVTPGRLLDAGFRFDFPEWPAAARDLCARWRSAK